MAMDTAHSFEVVASSILRSVIAIAIGKNLDDTPNIIGSGFAVEWPECFATCWHVAKTQDSLKNVSDENLEKKFKLKDNKLRVARMKEVDEYKWLELEEKTWFRTISKKDDICVYRAIGAPVVPAKLFGKDDYPWGAEVGVIGFPMGTLLQGKVTRAFWSKTIIAGGLELKLEGGEETERLALDSAFAGGFSGAPVFLATDGSIVGMIASKTLESDKSGQIWPAGISLAIPAHLIR
jgi:hypothetical protein